MTIKRTNAYKYQINALYLIGLILCLIIAYKQIHLRWRIGYVIF